MMLYSHFSAENSARARLAHISKLLWEIALSVRIFGQLWSSVLPERSFRRTLERLTAPIEWLRKVATSSAHWSEFLAPTHGAVSPEHAVHPRNSHLAGSGQGRPDGRRQPVLGLSNYSITRGPPCFSSATWWSVTSRPASVRTGFGSARPQAAPGWRGHR